MLKSSGAQLKDFTNKKNYKFYTQCWHDIKFEGVAAQALLGVSLRAVNNRIFRWALVTRSEDTKSVDLLCKIRHACPSSPTNTNNYCPHDNSEVEQIHPSPTWQEQRWLFNGILQNQYRCNWCHRIQIEESPRIISKLTLTFSFPKQALQMYTFMEIRQSGNHFKWLRRNQASIDL